MNRKSFLEQKRIGVLMRVFAQKEEDIPNRIELVRNLLSRLNHAGMIDGKMRISLIDVLVWADQRYTKGSKTKPDCGKTAQALREAFAYHDPGHGEDEFYLQNRLHVREVKYGDLFCKILNYGVAMQTRNRVDYSWILSPEAFPYVTNENFTEMIGALANGALATGIAIEDKLENKLELETQRKPMFQQSILDGRLANTCAIYENIPLLSVGGFDCRAELPVDERFAYYFRWWDGSGMEEALAGVEEVLPLARMIDTFDRPCIAPILPQGVVKDGYQVPEDPDLRERHLRKMKSKFERQSLLLAGDGFSVSYLKGGVMPEYKKF